jgi:hypothetical protein
MSTLKRSIMETCSFKTFNQFLHSFPHVSSQTSFLFNYFENNSPNFLWRTWWKRLFENASWISWITFMRRKEFAAKHAYLMIHPSWLSKGCMKTKCLKSWHFIFFICSTCWDISKKIMKKIFLSIGSLRWFFEIQVILEFRNLHHAAYF